MIGYGLLNSKVQEFCLSGIINSFLNRSVLYLYCRYLNYDSKNETEKESIIDSLYEIFIQEELRLSPRLFKNFTEFKNWETEVSPASTFLYYIDDNTENIVEVYYDKNGNYTNNTIEAKNYDSYPDVILKYILSSNVVFDKNYPFNLKSGEEVINDGKNNLKKLFKKVFEEFYNSSYFKSSEGGKKEEEIDYESYRDSIENQVTRVWNTAYDHVDKAESPFSDWWDNGGETFTDKVRGIVQYLDKISKENKQNQKSEKQNFINQLDSLIQTLQYVKNITYDSKFSYVDLSNDVKVVIPKKESSKEIVPLDAKGFPLSLKEASNFEDDDGDLNLRAILEYFIPILTFYYKKVTGQLKLDQSISASIKNYIKSAQEYGVYPSENGINFYDDENTTLINLSNYYVKNKGYINGLYKITYVDGSVKPGILQFYKSRKFLEDRTYYLKLLTGQINSLETIKIDEEESVLLNKD